MRGLLLWFPAAIRSGRVLDWLAGLGAVSFLGALAFQSAAGGLQALAFVAGPVALALVGWATYAVLTVASDIVDRLAPWLWRAARASFWTVFTAVAVAALLLVVGWQPIGGTLLLGCVLLAGGALLQAVAARS